MLKLIDIKKDYYLKDQEPVRALKGVSLNFRRNEFVAILGHSGCGKTTLLNIIGGLDKYTSGDLIIEGKSTKDYKDRDWDTYRNHSIGFVFQSYNLIPHQTLLQNVELALTISGISRKERIERAKESLKLVGLEGLEKKKPSQLSGGQMQRVAIARALVNNPEILLADEPTGALDTETSIQIMNLLKDVAKDRLVIMVTHNPELADKYASRIVRISDGLIISDSNPYEGEVYSKDRVVEKKVNKGNKKKTSMSFLTAAGLSMSNLLAKLKRTILVMVAGSIGIIGVTSVLAVSNGVNIYIDSMQNDMLSSYPVTIKEESIDYTSLITGLSSSDKKTLISFNPLTEVGLKSMIEYMMNTYNGFRTTKTNDISKEYLEYISKLSSDDVAVTSYDYGIDVTNNIFTSFHNEFDNSDSIISLNGLTQSYIAELKTVDGFSDYASYVDLFTDFMNEMPNNEEYILSQYDLLGNSRFATEEDEIMLVVDSDTTLTDLVLAQLGYYDHDEFLNIAKLAIEKSEKKEELTNANASQDEINKAMEELEEQYPFTTSFKYEDLIGKEFYYLPHDSIYSYGGISTKSYNQINVYMSSGNKVITLAYDESSDTMSGISLDTSNASYSIIYLQRTSEKSEVNNTEDVVKGTWAGIVGDMNHYAVVNINNTNGNNNMVWFTDDISSFNPVSTLPTFYSASTTVTPQTDSIYGYNYSATISNEVVDNISTYNGKKMKVVGILRPKSTTSFGCLSDGVYYTQKFADLYINDSINSEIINDETNGFKAFITGENGNSSVFNAYVTFEYIDYSDDNNNFKTTGYASCLNGDFSSSFSNLFSSITGVDYSEQNQLYLRSLCGLKTITTEEGTTFDLIPESIEVYPWDFESKNNVTNYLDAWNDNEDNVEITYTDTISVIAAVIDTLIDAITIALVSFTSLSLLVSCFMIAVITYISVMERVKEIGVIRSLGGRKKDVSRLFISETAITGLLSGVFGIIMTIILCVVLNAIIAPYNIGKLGALTVGVSVIMICLSVFLSVVSGFIPSMWASRQDPVTALRSE